MSSRPMAGSCHQGKGQRKGTTKSSIKPDYSIRPSKDVKPSRQTQDAPRLPTTPCKGTLIAMPFNETFFQSRSLPLQAGSTGIMRLRSNQFEGATSSPPLSPPYSPPHPTGDDNDGWGLDVAGIEEWEHTQQEQKQKDKRKYNRECYHRKKTSQYQRWQDDVIPQLIPLYQWWLRETDTGRHDLELDVWRKVEEVPCTCGQTRHRLDVVVGYWNRLDEIILQICKCKPAADQLMRRGLLGCAPLQPSMAFDLNLLELVSITMAYIAPNISGWASSLEWFWKDRGYALGPRWYNYLKDKSRWEVDKVVWGGQDLISPAASLPVISQMALKEVHAESSDVVMQMDSADTPDTSGSAASTTVPSQAGLASKIAHITMDSSLMALSETPPSGSSSSSRRAQPSPYLQNCCPLCFGGTKTELTLSKSHVLMAIDANFSQKCQKGKYEDINFSHPHSHFIPECEVEKVKEYVEVKRNRPASNKVTRLPEEVLQECGDCFVAADEAQVKASTAVYIDTGLVALVCRHDRLLWIINMTTAGERHHYAYCLLKQLFEHLPNDWNVGMLYDIACQIERGMVKHGILEEYYGRLSFAVSVFHAFGHEWPCQLCYHPRKVCGFGLTDGEGCERFWSSLKRLIPSLRVSGRHRRYTEVEWKAQVKYQTAPLKRQSKNAADQAIKVILDLRLERAEQLERIKALEKSLEQSDMHDPEDETVTLEELQTEKLGYDALKRRLQKREQELGVGACQKLESLKGNDFLRHKINANALKSRIRAKLISQKFERSRLERAYQHQVMRDKDHQQTKNLLKRTRQSITTLVLRYNNLVNEMKALKRQHRAPRGAQVPKALEARDLFRLDVDDEIWLDLALDGDNDKPPAWMSDVAVRACIPALLEVDRVKEEQERLSMERDALVCWMNNEVDRLCAALGREHVTPELAYQIQCRLRDLWSVVQHWKASLGPTFCDWTILSALEAAMRPGYTFSTSKPDNGKAPIVGSDSDDDSSSEDSSDSELSEQEEADLMELVDDAMDREHISPYVDLDKVFTRDGDAMDEADEASSEDDKAMYQPVINTLPTNKAESPTGYIGSSMQAESSRPSDNGHLTRPRSLLMGLIPDSSVLFTHRRWKTGQTCGSFGCGDDALERLTKGDKWFDGTIITVVAEALLQGTADKARAVHITPQVLLSVRRILQNPMDTGVIEGESLFVRVNASEIISRSSGLCLIPAHVPGHWTLLCLDLGQRLIRFHDSFPHGNYITKVKEEVYGLLDMVGVREGKEWEWQGEQRPQRQFNTHDCGAFVLADMASYINTGQCSTWGQGMMGPWRDAIWELMEFLRKSARYVKPPPRRIEGGYVDSGSE
ncbi:hypothetical protein M422DRAFT_257455 [Sphaerobolus stellatus SS14]|uniref:Ubiquitin-like protease family profile domain-containing protein n=1 Tax=Sphaerobolus stellatus (strain SS14) TaxID=990650 RepID=A0A0C9VNI5_SPHS4|nr:hypothetical protein M422DRAFT_257455 [Sphaerobolus stellatus SS14]